ncbi:olfactory receptor-like protein OLF4 [Bombina bombina]|uniref:olfactory receptor-like protein OLF4 n=1 Tax=Bombina bombina TaxID=8345 RepID=UPI00235A6A44|nr:olfactory receptor-like protein OLF4 [Bombina bombina]
MEFHILAFSTQTKKQPLLFIIFFFIYMTGIIGNLTILLLVSIDNNLHTPMYFFLGNLSFIDISFTTVSLPKFMDILITGYNSISFIQCLTQTYFSVFFSSTEVVLLSFMAYDRYLAICNPLSYHVFMNNKKCVMISLALWTTGCVNSFLLTGFASKLSFCKSTSLRQFYCDIKALTSISCDNTVLHNIISVESFVFGMFPLLLSLISYIKIIICILNMKSVNSKRKAFSTCTSHLTVLLIFYGTLVCVYMGSASEQAGEMDQVFSVLYTAVTPMLNPLIYSLRNREVKKALINILPINYLLISTKEAFT